MSNRVAIPNLAGVCLGLVVVLSLCSAASGSTISYTGTLASSSDFREFTFTLSSPGTVTLQTYGFGGGTNAAGANIPAGGTDPFLAIFSGTGPTATILTDGSGNAIGTALDETNFASFAGCPPAGSPVIGGSPVCGDITMSLVLGAGDYTVTLSDGLFIPYAVSDPVTQTLGDGFADLTAGNFCNLSINGVDCPNISGDYALDITLEGVPQPVPEPATAALVASGLAIAWWRRRRL